MHLWTHNDHVVLSHASPDDTDRQAGPRLHHIDLQRATSKPVNTHGHILTSTSTHALLHHTDPSRLAMLSIPSFAVVSTVSVECMSTVPLAAFVYDLHVFVVDSSRVFMFDQQLRREAEFAFEAGLRVQRAAFFVGVVGSKARLGLVCEAAPGTLQSFIIEYQWGASMALTPVSKVDVKPLAYLTAVNHSKCHLVCVLEDGVVLRVDPFSLQLEQTCDLRKHAKNCRIHGSHLLLEDDGEMAVFDMLQMRICKLTQTAFTFGNAPVRLRSVDHFVASPNGEYLIAFTDNNNLSHFTVFSVDGGDIDAMLFCKKLLSPNPLSVVDGWTFRQHIAVDKSTLRSFTSLLITQASEAGKGSNLGTVCRVLLFVAKFVPALAQGYLPFSWLNDLDRAVTMLTTMTGKPERIVQAVEEVMSKGASINLDDYYIPEPLDLLLTLFPLVRVQLERVNYLLTTNTHHRHLLALSSFRRRAVSIVAFAMALTSQMRDFEPMLDPTILAELKPIVTQYELPLDHLHPTTTAFIADLRSLAHSLTQLRAAKKTTEHDQSVSVLCMLLTGEPLSPDIIQPVQSLFLPHGPAVSAMPVYDSVRGCLLLQGVPASACRVCGRRTMRLDATGKSTMRLFYARWNDLYQGRCVCGGEYAV